MTDANSEKRGNNGDAETKIVNLISQKHSNPAINHPATATILNNNLIFSTSPLLILWRKRVTL